MPLATKNGSLIVKSGSLAENCNCCGGWYCYCDSDPCGLYSAWGLTPTTTATVTFSGIKTTGLPVWSNGSLVSGGVSWAKKPGVALNTTMCLSQVPRYWWLEDGRSYGDTKDLVLDNKGAVFEDRTAFGYTPALVVDEERIFRLYGKTALGIVFCAPLPGGYQYPRTGKAVKLIDTCSTPPTMPFSVTFSAADGDFGPIAGTSIVNKAYALTGWPTDGLAIPVSSNYWGYDLTSATATVTFQDSSPCPAITDQRAWWISTPYGSGGSVTPPPQSMKVTLSNATPSSAAARFVGEYTLSLGAYVSGYDPYGNPYTGTQHGSYYAAFSVQSGSKQITIAARPSVVKNDGVESVIWSLTADEYPKTYGWYITDVNAVTAPQPWSADISQQTWTGSGSAASYIGGGTLSVKVEFV